MRLHWPRSSWLPKLSGWRRDRAEVAAVRPSKLPGDFLVRLATVLAVVAASMVVLDAARHMERPPLLSWCLLASGIIVTLAANVAYGVTFGLAGALWAAWPAVAFVGCYELLMMLVRASAKRAQAMPGGTLSSAAPSTAELAAEASLRATLAAGNPLSANQIVERFLLTRATATKLRTRVLAGSNGHAPETDGETPPES